MITLSLSAMKDIFIDGKKDRDLFGKEATRF